MCANNPPGKIYPIDLARSEYSINPQDSVISDLGADFRLVKIYIFQIAHILDVLHNELEMAHTSVGLDSFVVTDQGNIKLKDLAQMTPRYER